MSRAVVGIPMGIPVGIGMGWVWGLTNLRGLMEILSGFLSRCRFGGNALNMG